MVDSKLPTTPSSSDATLAAARAVLAELTLDQVREIVAEAYVYTYPLVLMDVTRRMATNCEAGQKPGFGPMNQFAHMRAFPPADFREVVRPNFDTLYSIAWLDLTREPVIVSTPDTNDRYYLLPMLDMWTDVIAVPGKRTSGTKAAHFLVSGPGWSGRAPNGVTELRSPTPHVWVIGRTQTNGPVDYEGVHKVQAGYKVTPLSAWGKTAEPVKVTIDPSVDMATPPMLQVHNMAPERYFSYAAELMKLNPPHATDGSILLRMKRIGLEPGKSFSYLEFPNAMQEAFAEGAKQGLAALRATAAEQKQATNGWVTTRALMGVYGNEYLFRAAVAMIGLGANPPEDALYPINVADADGNPVLGGKKYRMHFAKSELPPVGAFWSLTMYDGDGFPVGNALRRHALGDRSGLKFNADGSLDIFIQPESPGKDQEANWLPSPKAGAVGMTLRLYAPKRAALAGEWNPPPVKLVDG